MALKYYRFDRTRSGRNYMDNYAEVRSLLSKGQQQSEGKQRW